MKVDKFLESEDEITEAIAVINRAYYLASGFSFTYT